MNNTEKQIYKLSLNKCISKLITSTILINECDAKAAGQLGYVPKILLQTPFPHSAPASNEFIVTNGKFTLEMIAPSSIGLPYGSIPRIILAWITTEAVKTKSKNLLLGANLTSFIEKLGFKSTGGKRGDITRVKDQLKRLLKTHITVSYTDGNADHIKNIQTISQSHILLSTTPQEHKKAWQSELILNQDFFDEITKKSVPIDLRVLQALKNSSLALDIYCWSTYRIFTIKRDTLIPWTGLFKQFGSGYSPNKSGRYAFKKKFIQQLKKVQLLYNDLRFEIIDKGIVILRSATSHIQPKKSPKPLLNIP